MAHVKNVEQSDGGRCGAQIDAASCWDTMLKVYWVRARNDLKHHDELGKNESGDKQCEKRMQRVDHHDGLVVLIPMVETVRKTDSVWVENGQNKKKSTNYK